VVKIEPIASLFVIYSITSTTNDSGDMGLLRLQAEMSMDACC